MDNQQLSNYVQAISIMVVTVLQLLKIDVTLQTISTIVFGLVAAVALVYNIIYTKKNNNLTAFGARKS